MTVLYSKRQVGVVGGEGKEGVEWFSSCSKHDEVRIKSFFACSRADLKIRVIIVYIIPNAVGRIEKHQTACVVGKLHNYLAW